MCHTTRIDDQRQREILLNAQRRTMTDETARLGAKILRQIKDWKKQDHS